MSEDNNAEFANRLDCGDGVPHLDMAGPGNDDVARVDYPEPMVEISAGVLAGVGAGFGLGAVALIILVGGNPLVGAVAAAMIVLVSVAVASTNSFEPLAVSNADAISRIEAGVEPSGE